MPRSLKISKPRAFMQRSTILRGLFHRAVIGPHQPAFQRALTDIARDHRRAGDSPNDYSDGHFGLALRALVTFVFSLRLHRHRDVLTAIRLLGGHVGIVAVDQRPVVAK